jgi:nitrite reductase (NADH) large subunit
MSAVVRKQPLVDARPEQAPAVIVGTGPVGMRVAQEILARDPGYPLVLFGDEPWHPYNRVRLSSLLAGDLPWDDLQTPLRTDAHPHVVQYHNCPVTGIDTARNVVIDRDGRTHRYARLILAVGSRPHIPEIPGISQQGVYRFRDMSDVQALAARSARSRHTVVLGGGLLGLEAARGLCRAGTRVTVVEHAAHLMSGQLDQEAGDLLAAHLERMGIRILTGQSVREVVGDGQVHALRLQREEIPCDTLVVAAGIRPNIALALDAGLRVNRGIVVDDRCMTSDPAIYAIGECAEHRGRVYGLVGPGFEQAAVVAHRIVGEAAAYTGSRTVARLKVLKQTVVSMGEVEEGDRLRGSVWRYRDSATGVYRKLVVRRGRLIGVIAIGEWGELNRIHEAAQSHRRLYPWQLRRFARSGSVWPEAEAAAVCDWPADAIVCNCMGVTRGTLSAAIAAGSTRTEQLMSCTGASTVCGSCRPLLAELTGTAAMAPDTTGRRVLLLSAVTAGLTIPVMLALPDLRVSDSVTDPLYRIGNLWRDGFWKQISGFSLLGLGLLGLSVSARKRVARVNAGHYGHWRAMHALLGMAAVLLLSVHTGLQTGERLNAWLLANYLALALLGAVAAISVASTRVRSRARRLTQQWLSRAHLYLAWPLPALLGFHVLSVYYF